MQAIIEVKHLQEAVKQAGKVAGTRSNMPILGTVRIDASLEGLAVSATNLEAWGRSTIECLTQTDAGPNSVLVSASLLAKLAGKLPRGEVLLTAPKAGEGESGILTIGGAVIPTMPLRDYPDTPQAGAGDLVGVFAGDVFKGLVKRLKAASKSHADSWKMSPQTRRGLIGVNVIYGAGCVSFAASDGFRLLLEEYATDCTESGRVLVDAAELARVATLAKAGDVVTLEVLPADPEAEFSIYKRARFVVSFSSARYTLRGIDEEFPDFERVIPKYNATEFTVSRKSLLDAVRRGLIVAPVESGAVTLELEDGSSVLQMSSDSRELGSYHEYVRLEDAVWDPCELVTFNGSYIEDVLKLGKSSAVRVALGGRLQAALFSTDADNVPGRTRQAWVLMPVNVDR